MLDFLQFPYSETQLQSLVSKGYNTFKRNHSLDGDFERFTPAQRLFVNSLVRTTNTKLEEHGLADKYNLTSYLSHWFYHFIYETFMSSVNTAKVLSTRYRGRYWMLYIIYSAKAYSCSVSNNISATYSWKKYNHIVDFIHWWWLWSHSVFSVHSLQSVWGSRGWEFPYLNFFSTVQKPVVVWKGGNSCQSALNSVSCMHA